MNGSYRIGQAAVLLCFSLVGACGGSVTSTSSNNTTDTTHKTSPLPVSVVVRPDSTVVSVGSTVQMTATVLGGSGMTNVDQGVVWSSGSPKLASVDVTGLVRALAPGELTIMARSTAISTVFNVGKITIVP